MTTNAARQQFEYAQLKQQFESCNAIVARARTRAIRAAEEAVALRALIKARAKDGGRSTEAQDIWAAAARAIAEMARERDQILGTVSHEMRQALSAALTAEHLLLEHTSESAATKAADVLDRQLLHLTKLVELLLDYTRLAIGTSVLAGEQVDVRQVVRETFEACEAGGEQAGLEFTLQLSAEPQVIDGDPTRLRQLVSNLIHNALRYTPPGGRVHCSTVTLEGTVHIVIADTGAGIAAADLDRIFEPFTRRSTDGAGLGVGLAIARRIAQLHGGFLTARSDGEGCGATFTVVLPLAHASS